MLTKFNQGLKETVDFTGFTFRMNIFLKPFQCFRCHRNIWASYKFWIKNYEAPRENWVCYCEWCFEDLGGDKDDECWWQ